MKGLKEYNIQLNMCERSDIDLPNVRIMRQYLRGYANRLSTVDETTDKTKWRFNVFMVSESPKT